MKKSLLVLVAAVVVFLGGARVQAGENVAAPAGEQSNPINADYGGVDIWTTNPGGLAISTIALPVNAIQNQVPGTYGFLASTTTPNLKSRWRVYGAYFSTGNCGAGDFIEVSASTGGYVAVGSTTSVSLRFYNLFGSTGATVAGNGNNNGACAGVTYLRWPIRMYGNLYMKASNLIGYNSQGLLYWKEPD